MYMYMYVFQVVSSYISRLLLLCEPVDYRSSNAGQHMAIIHIHFDLQLYTHVHIVDKQQTVFCVASGGEGRGVGNGSLHESTFSVL